MAVSRWSWWVGVCVAVGGCQAPLQKFDFVQPKMGTVFHMTLYAADANSAGRAADAAWARVDQLNKTLSDYDPNSELSRLSQQTNNGPMFAPVKVSDDLWRICSKSWEVSDESDASFDITVGPFVRLWRRSRELLQLPTPERLEAARASVGYRKMELDAVHHAVLLNGTKMRLDAGGIGKGYAAAEALAVLRGRGVRRALVGAAGDIAAGDPPPGTDGWVVGFETPGASDRGTSGIYVRLNNRCVSTSGDTYRFVEIDGKHYSHIIDPHTGLGLTRRIEGSVISPDGMTADTWALVLCVLGPEKALPLIEKLPGAAAVVTTFDDGKSRVYRSSRFAFFETQKGNEQSPVK